MLLKTVIKVPSIGVDINSPTATHLLQKCLFGLLARDYSGWAL